MRFFPQAMATGAVHNARFVGWHFHHRLGGGGLGSTQEGRRHKAIALGHFFARCVVGMGENRPRETDPHD